MAQIQSIKARSILDSRGNPTVEVDVRLSDKSFARASVPSGASTGKLEAVELRDTDVKAFHGKGVEKAVRNVNEILAPKMCGLSADNQAEIDDALNKLDGTPNKASLGANAILGVSMAVCRAASVSQDLPLYEYLARTFSFDEKRVLPTPMFNILNGGVHADSSLDFQEFMIAPMGAKSVREAVEMGSEVYHSLKAILKRKGYSVSVGDEGGFAPQVKANVEAIELILEAITKSGFTAGRDIVIALDPAASEFYEDGLYHFKKSDGRKLSSEEMIEYWNDWVRQFPIASLEDGLAETDWDGWKTLTEKLGERVQLVGDDIFVTNPVIIQKAIRLGIGNASLIKLNQIGTVSETMAAIQISKKAGYGTVISHRSGETADDFISDLAVATNAGQMKTGAPARGERVAKYNQLMRIEEELGARAGFAGSNPFIHTK